MPTSAAVFRPLPALSASLWYVLTPKRASMTNVLVKVRVQLPAALCVLLMPVPTKPPW